MTRSRGALLASTLFAGAYALAASCEVAGEKHEVKWRDGALVYLDPEFKMDRDLYAAPDSLAYVAGAAVPGDRDIQFSSSLTGRYGKSAGDYRAHDLDLRLMRPLGDIAAVSLDIGFTQVNIGDALPLSDPAGMGLRRIGLATKAVGKAASSDGWATSATIAAGINQMDPVSGRTAPGFYTGGYTAAESPLAEKCRYLANYGYELNTADHLLTGGRIDRTLYFRLQLSHGLTCQVTPTFSLGLENRLRTDFIDFERFDATAIHLGPSCRYATRNMSATFCLLPQLWGKPNHAGHRDLVAHEKLEVRLQLTVAF